MNWKSVATWEKDGLLKETEDLHHTLQDASNVCTLLLKEYSKRTPCETRGVCVSAVVKSREGNQNG